MQEVHSLFLVFVSHVRTEQKNSRETVLNCSVNPHPFNLHHVRFYTIKVCLVLVKLNKFINTWCAVECTFNNYFLINLEPKCGLEQLHTVLQHISVLSLAMSGLTSTT